MNKVDVFREDTEEVEAYRVNHYNNYLNVVRDSARYRYEFERNAAKLAEQGNSDSSVYNIGGNVRPKFINSEDKNFFRTSPIGYGSVYILKGVRNVDQISYIKFVEGLGHPNYVKLSEDVFSPASTPFWNNFHPMFAYYITTFAGVLNQKGIITGRIPISSGFRTADYAVSLTKRNEDAVAWSPHRTGLAVDITCKSDAQRDKVLAEAYAFGFGGLGRGSYYCHIDISAEGLWGYPPIAPFSPQQSR